jgi:predicted amidohydrolase YtcJ
VTTGDTQLDGSPRSSGDEAIDVDLVVENALIRTLDEQKPRASRMAVVHGRVVALDEDVDGLRPRHTIDLDGATVLPGFNDAHCHPVLLGLTLNELDLSDGQCRNLDDLYRAVTERVPGVPVGGWIIGAGYDQSKLGSHPTRAMLDTIAPDHFVWLRHRSGHMCVVNSRVLQAAGVHDGETSVLVGGVVDPETGLLEEQAQLLVRNLVLPLSEEQVADALQRASRLALSQGVTSWTDAGVGGGWIGHSAREIGGYLLARRTGRLSVRTTLMVASECLHLVDRHADDSGELGLDAGIRTGLGDDRLRIGAAKFFTDGSLIGRTAAMHDPYEGEPSNVGYFQDDVSTLHERMVEAHLAGWQVAVHAIGDRAVDLVLDAIEDAQRRLARPDARHRIEHAGLVSAQQAARFADLKIVPVPQGEFVSVIGDGMAESVGERRAQNLYRQRSFLRLGLCIPGSSDRPVVPGAPLTGIRDLVIRRTASGRVLGPGEQLEVMQALRAWTVGSAYAEHAEDQKGTLIPGMLADFVVLADDPCAVSPDQISEIGVLSTFIGGECAYSATGHIGELADQLA